MGGQRERLCRGGAATVVVVVVVLLRVLMTMMMVPLPGWGGGEASGRRAAPALRDGDHRVLVVLEAPVGALLRAVPHVEQSLAVRAATPLPLGRQLTLREVLVVVGRWEYGRVRREAAALVRHHVDAVRVAKAVPRR